MFSKEDMRRLIMDGMSGMQSMADWEFSYKVIDLMCPTLQVLST